MGELFPPPFYYLNQSKNMMEYSKIKLAVIHGLASVGKMVNYSDKDRTIQHLKDILKDIYDESRAEGYTKRQVHSEQSK